jgi:shikimate dehydrogenase
MSVLKAALLGKSLSHSASPELHKELFKILRHKFEIPYLDISYESIELEETCDVAQFLKTASTNGYIGANVTYPYKSTVFDLAEHKIGTSSFINSGNCLRFANNEVSCASTDGVGSLYSVLRKYPSFNLERYNLVLVGAGSAARAVVYELCTKWMPQSLTIANRDISRAEELVEFCLAQSPGPTVRYSTLDDLVHAPHESKYRCIIQCTPVGQIHTPGNLLHGFNWHETDLAIDLIYNPIQTEFLSEASRGGAKIINGLGMLIEQAALSQVFWLTGLLPDSSPLSDAEFQALHAHLTRYLS